MSYQDMSTQHELGTTGQEMVDAQNALYQAQGAENRAWRVLNDARQAGESDVTDEQNAIRAAVAQRHEAEATLKSQRWRVSASSQA